MGDGEAALTLDSAFRLLAQLSPDLIALADPDERVTFLNDCGRRMLGISPGAELGQLRLGDLFTGEARARFEDEERRALGQHGHWHGETTLRRADTGELVPVEGSSHLVRDPRTGQTNAIAIVRRDISRLARVHEEQLSVTEIATAIAQGEDQQPLLDAVAARSRAATCARAAAIVRASGTSRELVARDGEPEGALAASEGLPGADLHDIRRCEIVVHGRPWGWLAVVGPEVPEDEAIDESLERFARLAATALLTCQTRERLLRQATTDFVTGLANHRALHQRLLEESSRARRSGEGLAVVVMDIDGFKQVNDEHGHAMGDQVLRDLGQVLRMEVREHDLAARLGGDEFVLLLPAATALEAYQVAARCRSSFIASGNARGLEIALSAGVCDRSEDRAADEILRLADEALYWAKRNGTGVVIHDDRVVRGLSSPERAQSMERSQVLGALRVLARVADLKDPGPHRHSRRVASLARCLAAAAGWSEERQRLLHEAGLVHDVGKLAVPDAILSKPDRLTDAERREIETHPALGAQIAAGALSGEQVRWIREHHERPDGTGYPDGRRDGEISDGAQLLAVAEAWDVMSTGRSYQPRVGAQEALAQCRSLAGTQFSQWALDALAQCWERSAELSGEAIDLGGAPGSR